MGGDGEGISLGKENHLQYGIAIESYPVMQESKRSQQVVNRYIIWVDDGKIEHCSSV